MHHIGIEDFERYTNNGSLDGIQLMLQNGFEKNIKFSEMNLNDEKFRKYLKLFLCSSIGRQWKRYFDYEDGKTLNCSSSLAPKIKMISFDYWHVE